MPTIDDNGALHDNLGRFAEQNKSAAGFDLAADPTPSTGAPVKAAEVRVGDVLHLDGDLTQTVTVTSIDGDHRDMSIEFDNDESTIATYQFDDVIGTRTPAAWLGPYNLADYGTPNADGWRGANEVFMGGSSFGDGQAYDDFEFRRIREVDGGVRVESYTTAAIDMWERKSIDADEMTDRLNAANRDVEESREEARADVDRIWQTRDERGVRIFDDQDDRNLISNLMWHAQGRDRDIADYHIDEFEAALDKAAPYENQHGYLGEDCALRKYIAARREQEEVKNEFSNRYVVDEKTEVWTEREDGYQFEENIEYGQGSYLSYRTAADADNEAKSMADRIKSLHEQGLI